MKSLCLSLKYTTLAAALLACASCSMDHGPPPRDFNELIPRLMGAINKTTPEEAASNLFNVTSPDERRDAIAYLQTKPYGHQPPYMKAYEILTTDPHPMVRGQAMLALGTSHQADAVSYLIKGLNDSNADVRRDSAVGLTQTYTDDAIAPLIEHVKGDVDAAVRINCARALKSAATAESAQALIAALSDRDVAVVAAAVGSLKTISGQYYGDDRKAWQAWYQQMYAPPPHRRPRRAPIDPGLKNGHKLATNEHP